MINIQLVVNVRASDDGTDLWADLPQLPGVFAAGQTPTELGTSLGSAVELILNQARATAGLPPFPHPLPVGPAEPTADAPSRPADPTDPADVTYPFTEPPAPTEPPTTAQEDQ